MKAIEIRHPLIEGVMNYDPDATYIEFKTNGTLLIHAKDDSRVLAAFEREWVLRRTVVGE